MRSKKHPGVIATLLGDGRIEVDGTLFSSPSDAAKAITGNPTSGWWFFLVERAPRRSLKDIRSEYVESLSVDADEDESDDDSAEEDA
jgi:hypothetical protein